MASVDQPRVKIYTSPGCGFCDLAKAYLNLKGTVFEEIDISLDSAAADYIIEQTGQAGVPVLVFGQKNFVVGFNRPMIDSYIAEID